MVVPYVSEVHRWAEFVLWPLVRDAAAGTAKLLQVCDNSWDCTGSLAPTLLDWRGSCSAAPLLTNEGLWRRSGLPDVPRNVWDELDDPRCRRRWQTASSPFPAHF